MEGLQTDNMKQAQKTQKKKWSAGLILLLILAIAILTVGVGMICYPTVSDWWNNLHQSRAIAGYIEKTADLTKEQYDQMWAEAEAYNRSLVGNAHRYTPTDEEDAHYKSILDATGTGIMGYIQIPRINVDLPIYHTTDEAVLETAVGHMEGTSLPVGGKGTHCVLSGHRGLPSARLFTDIDKLKTGDIFTLQILNRTLTYKVDHIDTVLPNEIQDLKIDPEEDYCTLVTCTPYGVNTHRLLVRGHRIENSEEDFSVTADALQYDPYYVLPVLCVLLAFVTALWLIISAGSHHRDLKRKNKTHGDNHGDSIARKQDGSRPD